MISTIITGLLIPFAGTSLGAAMVFFFSKQISANLQKIFTGFAAGAMLYVVVEELIPEMSEGEHSNIGTISFSIGFVLMMIIDVSLG